MVSQGRPTVTVSPGGKCSKSTDQVVCWCSARVVSWIRIPQLRNVQCEDEEYLAAQFKTSKLGF